MKSAYRRRRNEADYDLKKRAKPWSKLQSDGQPDTPNQILNQIVIIQIRSFKSKLW